MKKILISLAIAMALTTSVFAQTSPTVRVNSLAELVALPIPTAATYFTAIVSGSAAAGDSPLAAVFAYVPGSSAATNTFGVFKPTATTGRWIKITTDEWNQFSAATANDSSSYAFQMYRNMATNIFGIGADNNNTYIQSFGSYALHLNNIGNNTILNATAGSVGVGTTSPSNLLTVEKASTSGLVKIYNSAGVITAAQAILEVRSDDISDPASHDLLNLNNGGTVRVLVEAGGNVGIGTGTPTTLLSVGGATGTESLAVTNAATVGTTLGVTGAATLSSTVSVGGGATIRAIYSAATALDFPSIVANSQTNLTMTVTGAGTNSTVNVSAANGTGIEAGVSLGQAWVSATNTVTVTALNLSAGAIDPAALDVRVTVFQY